MELIGEEHVRLSNFMLMMRTGLWRPKECVALALVAPRVLLVRR